MKAEDTPKVSHMSSHASSSSSATNPIKNSTNPHKNYLSFSEEGSFQVERQRNGGYDEEKDSEIQALENVAQALISENDYFEDDYDDEDDMSMSLMEYLRSLYSSLDRDAVHYGARIASCLFTASLFALIHTKEDKWPAGSWVYISTLMVSWFPQMDAASVIKKSLQRCMGTIFGGFLGLSCGFLSLLMPDDVTQSLFLGFCIAVVTFSVGFFACQIRLSRRASLMDQYSYAAMLCLMTYGIALFPFIGASPGGKPKWHGGVFRIINVTFGCIIGCLGSIVVLPRSTTKLLHERIQKKCKLAGEASEAVLHAAADVFSGNVEQVGLLDELMKSMAGGKSTRTRMSLLRKSFVRVNKDIIEDEGDVALEKYESAIKAWRDTKGLFGMLGYDPFHCFVSSQDKKIYQTKCASTLARALRIQTTVVLLDGIVRNDPKHDCFDKKILSLFAEIGTLTRKMLSVPLKKEDGLECKSKLLEKIALIRKAIISLCEKVSQQPLGSVIVPFEDDDDDTYDFEDNDYDNNNNNDSYNDDDETGVDSLLKRNTLQDSYRNSVVCDTSHVYALLFLQLIEHLTVRCCSLYDSWLKVEQAAEKLDLNKKLK